MSSPFPTQTVTKNDLDTYLDMIQKRKNTYEVNNIVKHDPYNDLMIKKLDKMAVEAMDRFHNN